MTDGENMVCRAGYEAIDGRSPSGNCQMSEESFDAIVTGWRRLALPAPSDEK